jgi:radical SAM protein with 4Fe4S-binding SPASM domain
MKHSLYVVETTHNARPVLYNTVTKEHLPADAKPWDLARHYFLAGQEKEAIWSYLLRPSQKAAFTVVNTWECNLRCTHCTVIDKLVKNDPLELDPVKTMGFLGKFVDYYKLPKALLTFVGGEPLLRPQDITKCMDLGAGRDYLYGITTNLTVKFTDAVWDTLRRLDNICVSLDGLEEAHNRQRKPLALVGDPFSATIENIKNLVKAGMAYKISVQSALKDEYLTPQHRRDYYRLLMKLGIKYDHIKFACIHPTNKNPEPGANFLRSLQMTKAIAQPCCKYRYFNHVIDRDGTVFADYYTWEKVGTVADSMETIDTAARKIIGRMPALNDPTCQACPALGSCWGGCTNGSIVVGDYPSKYCDQAGLIKTMNALAASGELVQ